MNTEFSTSRTISTQHTHIFYTKRNMVKSDQKNAKFNKECLLIVNEGSTVNAGTQYMVYGIW